MLSFPISLEKVLKIKLSRKKDHLTSSFMSFFPNDAWAILLSQVCRNINRVKMCMETGRTVILLNLDNLYESLYDALNQVS